ncbi:signal transduction histidine kinase [Arthrobacter stackebrandtii]|uniref:histidine kinase n=1 Tax=Arthrobacter stackebrandtii TaxID=272161 RepID=A0ABS4Z172_9MICC|nr:histidine kinase [Arthrobacter stackebrandtii]MBP2414804.1 signal transduction histidine kinase [Arthrobacter stackebrandtii]PYG99463.1 histidine kinase [Arthrobacter stackebrandtii]
MKTTAWGALAARPWQFWASRWPWLALLYMLLSAVLGAVLLPVVVATFVFIPFWGLGLGALERRRVQLLGFAQVPSAHAPVAREQRYIWLNIRMSEAATWRAAGNLVTTLLLGWLALALLAVEIAALAVMVTMVVAASRGPSAVTLFGDVQIPLAPSQVWIVCLAGVLLLAALPYINMLFAAGQASLARFLLAPRNVELQRNLERLTLSRVSLVAAFEQERKRIERDLHDGVQQELVALSVALGLAGMDLELVERAGAPVAEARASVATAHDQAEHALRSLRTTVRGIHPAVLSDHGLEAALAELCGRAGLPVTLEATVGRMDAATEACAYFTASEAIANALKHSNATNVSVRARHDGGALLLSVADNGHGGADTSRGTGLRGLSERAETLGGSLTLCSPVGGPTTLELSLPAEAGHPASNIS